MDIEFKNVNQGDSIVITWDDNGQLKTGIIDCHSENLNPALQHVKKHVKDEIEFIIISHPHFDHFSGVLELLNYCRSSSIAIKRFGFTFNTAVSFVYQQFYSFGRQKSLFDLFEFISSDKRKAEKNRTIKSSTSIRDTTENFNYSEFDLIFRGPRDMDLIGLEKSLGKFGSGTIKSLPDLNVYSTIIEILKDGKSVLCTADAPTAAFKGLFNFYKKRDSLFHLVQIPHHGSRHNFYQSFWNKLNRIEGCPSVFSVGNEVKDKLPDLSVVQAIDGQGYTIHSTNIVYGIKDFLNIKTNPKKSPSILNHSSKLINRSSSVKNSDYQGDQKFTI